MLSGLTGMALQVVYGISWLELKKKELVRQCTLGNPALQAGLGWECYMMLRRLVECSVGGPGKVFLWLLEQINLSVSFTGEPGCHQT